MRLGHLHDGEGVTVFAEDGGQRLPIPRVAPDGPATIDALIQLPDVRRDDLTAALLDGFSRGLGDAADTAVSLAPPVLSPSKIVAIGLNYHDHAQETGLEVPKSPLLFTKFPSSLCGHGDEIEWDDNVTNEVDLEVELTVVIGRRLRSVPVEHALDGVFGYTIANDVSARDVQFGDGQWVRGKSLETFCPLGPVVVTADDVGDPQVLAMTSSINGSLMQDSSTAKMVFSVAQIISYVSEMATLMPGDLLLTSTPAGVGYARRPPIFLRDGDEVSMSIENIGTLTNTCRVRRATPSW